LSAEIRKFRLPARAAFAEAFGRAKPEKLVGLSPIALRTFRLFHSKFSNLQLDMRFEIGSKKAMPSSAVLFFYSQTKKEKRKQVFVSDPSADKAKTIAIPSLHGYNDYRRNTAPLKQLRQNNTKNEIMNQCDHVTMQLV
jgi:hypothetical protein